MPHEATKLVLGRGEVYFDRFVSGTRVGEGERYLGNTMSFRVQRDLRTSERAIAYGGHKITQVPAVISESHTIDFVTDHVEAENLAMWFASSVVPVAVPADTVTETLIVTRGRFYQLGKSVSPVGVTHVTQIVVRIAGVVVNPTNYVADEMRARLEIVGDIFATPTEISVSFACRPNEGVFVTSKADQVIGSLRFVAYNEGPVAKEQQVDYFFPYVTIMPRGQTDLKGDEFQQWGFDATAMNLTPLMEQMYVLRVASVGSLLSDEEAIIAEFGDLTTFPYWDDQLSVAVNTDWPHAVDFNGVI